MERLKDNELDALEAALAKATPGEWTVDMDGPDDDDSPCDVVIPEINRILHSTEWADPEDFDQDVANAEAIVAAHNALSALLAEVRDLRRLTTPEPISEKHRDKNWWLVWAPGAEQWMKCRWLGEYWGKSGTMREQLFDDPTYALPLPEPPAARGEE
jgi:hypothetical protein